MSYLENIFLKYLSKIMSTQLIYNIYAYFYEKASCEGLWGVRGVTSRKRKYYYNKIVIIVIIRENDDISEKGRNHITLVNNICKLCIVLFQLFRIVDEIQAFKNKRIFLRRNIT